jgi:hypothetical protein
MNDKTNSLHKQVPSIEEHGPDGLDISTGRLQLSHHIPSPNEDALQCSRSWVLKFESITYMHLRIATSIENTLLPST